MNIQIQDVYLSVENIKEGHRKTADILKTMITHMRFIEEKIDKLYIKTIKNEFLSIVRGELNMIIKTVGEAYELSLTNVEIEKKLLKLAQDRGFDFKAFKEWDVFDESNLTNIELIKKYLISNSAEIHCIKNALKVFMILYESQ